MTRIGRNIVIALALGALVAGVSGCKKEGPMERAGKDIDKAIEKTGEKIEKAGGGNQGLGKIMLTTLRGGKIDQFAGNPVAHEKQHHQTFGSSLNSSVSTIGVSPYRTVAKSESEIDAIVERAIAGSCGSRYTTKRGKQLTPSKEV